MGAGRPVVSGEGGGMNGLMHPAHGLQLSPLAGFAEFERVGQFQPPGEGVVGQPLGRDLQMPSLSTKASGGLARGGLARQSWAGT